MAIFVSGMPCGLCGLPMLDGQGRTCFAAFVENLADPMALFSDGCFHTTCFHEHPLAARVVARYAEAKEKSRYANKICQVCGRQIELPDDYFGLGYLTADASSDVFDLNYAHFHRKCMPQFHRLRRLIEFGLAQLATGAWRGGGTDNFVEQLRSFAASAPSLKLADDCE